MFIMAGLMIPCGLLVGLASAFDFSQMSSDPSFQLAEQQFASIGWSISGFLKVFAAIITIPGIILLVLGVMVRRGGLGSIISSIIVCCLMALLALVCAFGGMVQASQGGQAVIGILVWVVVLIVLIAIIVFLIQGAKNAGAIAQHRMAYQAQMHQYQQYPGIQHPSQQPQAWQQQPGQWSQPAWPPQQQPPQPPSQNWPPPPSNPT